MADKNLHDIKIDDLDNQKKTPLKNILTLLALLFIILVISVVITRLILNTDEGEEIEAANLSNTEIATETQADENNTNALSLAAGAVAGAATSAANTVKDTASNTANSVKAPDINTVITERNVTTSKTKVTLRDHQPVKKEISTPKKSTSTSSSNSGKSYITPAPKQATSTTTSSKSVASYTLTQGYYIKVGTFKDTTNAIKKVEKTGLNYKLIKTKNDKTMTRVLIGPFSEKEAAQSHLKDVQENITTGAYITRIK